MVIGGFGYGFTIERKERRRFWVLENFVMGSQSQSHHSHIKHLASLNSSPNRPCMLVSFFFFFLFFLFFFRFNTYPLFNFLSLFGFQENKREKNIGYCSLCCLSFILLCKGWNFWFVFDWEGERNFGFSDLCCWGSCKDERLIESWAKWVFKTKIEEFDFFYSYMVDEKIWENLGMSGKKKNLGMFFMFKIDVNWERDQYHFLILFLLHFLCYFLF